MNPTRQQRRAQKRENAKMPDAFQEVPRSAWPHTPDGLRRVWRSRRFLVQEFDALAPARARLTVCRTSLAGTRFQDGITWDELQAIKSEVGFGSMHAVEVYPAEADLVNVGNMRHLWVLTHPMEFAWRAGL